jgi:polysaccharide biosynthesis PFTS motif protein
VHRRYTATVERLAASGGIITIDPDTSAHRVIERTAAVISFPFTSTALIARQLGKPSIYYDPHGFIQAGDRAAHGIPVVSGIDALRRWVAELDVEPWRATAAVAGGGA